MKIRKFFLRDVRCFKGEKEFNISPLTFLVGENSTGKSTILGCIQALAKSIEKNRHLEIMDPVEFNFEPFDMGDFENIIRKASPKITKFELGFKFYTDSGMSREFELRATMVKEPKFPEYRIKEARFIYSKGEIRFIFDSIDKYNKLPPPTVKRKGSKKIFTIPLTINYKQSLFFEQVLYRFRRSSAPPYWNNRVREANVEFNSAEKQFLEFIKNDPDIDNFLSGLPLIRLFSFAPIRSEPQRTYEPWCDIESPIGSEIPIILRDLSIGKGQDWKQLQEKLQAFGKSSGLFTDIKIKNLEGSSTSPFQIELKIRRAQLTNLVDVGHGVSQILPLLIQVLTADGYTFLMQQPEVHLHPKAQAELASLLIELSKQKNNNFIIETHSDYMINRARIEIMHDKIKPEDVSLIYLEPKGSDVKVHNLGFNRKAEIIPTPPDSYREFFFSETHKLLGWDD